MSRFGFFFAKEGKRTSPGRVTVVSSSVIQLLMRSQAADIFDGIYESASISLERPPMKTLSLPLLAIVLWGAMPESASAGLSSSLGLTTKSTISKKVMKQAKRAAKHNRGSIQIGAVVSPYTTVLAQLFHSEENLFIQIHDDFMNSLLSKRQAKHQTKKLVRQSYKAVDRTDRKEFKLANSIKKGGVKKDWLAYVFQNGVIPVYF